MWSKIFQKLTNYEDSNQPNDTEFHVVVILHNKHKQKRKLKTCPFNSIISRCELKTYQ